MPPRKQACSLCHELVEELKYHYDICSPCHQDVTITRDVHDDTSDEDYQSDDDTVSVHGDEAIYTEDDLSDEELDAIAKLEQPLNDVETHEDQKLQPTQSPKLLRTKKQ